MQDNLKLSKILNNSNANVNFQKQVLGLPSIMEKLQDLKNECGEHEYSYAQTLILYGGDHIVMQWLGNDCKKCLNLLSASIEIHSDVPRDTFSIIFFTFLPYAPPAINHFNLLSYFFI